MCDGHKEVWVEMATDVRVSNARFKLVNSRLRRIEEKLFTEEENMAFYLGKVEALANECGVGGGKGKL